MGLLATLVVFYTIVFVNIEASLNPILIIPLFFTIFAFVGTAFYSHDFRMWLTLILMFVTFIIFYYSFIAIEKEWIIICVIVSGFLCFAIYFLIHYTPTIINSLFNKKFPSKLGSDFDNVNTIGFYFAVAFVLSLYETLFHKKLVELVYIAPAILFFTLGLFTGSRAFIVSALAGAIAVIFFRLKKRKLIFVAILATLVGLFFILIRIPALSELKDRYDRALFTLFGVGNSKVEESTVQRMVWPQYAFYLGGKNLLIGYGCDGFKNVSGVATYSHNNFSEVICNFGIIGFIFYHLSFFVPLGITFKLKARDYLLVPIIVVVYLSRCFFGVIYYAKEAYLIIALCFYLVRDYKFSPTKIFKKKTTSPLDYYEVSI